MTDTIVLPLGPRHAVAINSQDGVRSLPVSAVEIEQNPGHHGPEERSTSDGEPGLRRSSNTCHAYLLECSNTGQCDLVIPRAVGRIIRDMSAVVDVGRTLVLHEAQFGIPFDAPLAIEEYRPEWVAHFATVRRWLQDALGTAAVRIDHIGSTAVPGLAAKPVIDVQVAVADINDESCFRPAIESVGYAFIHHDEPDRYFFRRREGLRDAHVHVTGYASEWSRLNVLFRDYLRANPQIAKSYVDLKRKLAAEHGRDRAAYTEGKTEFVIATLATAGDWAIDTGWAGFI